MAIGTADIFEGIVKAWRDANLDVHFKTLWQSTQNNGQYTVLHDQEATPKQPFPYCVCEIANPRVLERMSYTADVKREIRQTSVTFNVHADAIANVTKSAKKIAAELIEEIMKVYGGHPLLAPSQTITIGNGSHVITQYDTDYPIRNELYKWNWILRYTMKFDIPVAV